MWIIYGDRRCRRRCFAYPTVLINFLFLQRLGSSPLQLKINIREAVLGDMISGASVESKVVGLSMLADAICPRISQTPMVGTAPLSVTRSLLGLNGCEYTNGDNFVVGFLFGFVFNFFRAGDCVELGIWIEATQTGQMYPRY